MRKAIEDGLYGCKQFMYDSMIEIRLLVRVYFAVENK